MYKLFFPCLALYTLISMATTPADASTSLQTHRIELDQIEQTLKSLRTELDTKESILERHNHNHAEAQQMLRESERELVAAKASADASNEETLEREVKRIQVRFDRHTAKVNRYRQRRESTQSAIAQLSKDISALQQKRIQHTNAVRELIKQSNEQKRAQEKAARLKKQKSPLALAATDPLVANEPALSSRPASWPYLETSTDADIVFARQTLAQLKQLNSQGKVGDAPLDKVEIHARLSFGRAEMEYLGDNLFGVTRTVSEGRQNFVLFNQDHWHTIPPASNNTNYRFIFDVSSLSNPKLHLFKADLISE